MPAIDRPTAIATIVYCAVNASTTERSRRRRTFGGLAAARSRVSSPSTVLMRLVFGQDLIEARLQPPVGALAGPELARPVQRNHVAHLARFREHQARCVPVAPDQAGQTGKTPARDF